MVLYESRVLGGGEMPSAWLLFSSGERHTRSSTVSWARRCVEEAGAARHPGQGGAGELILGPAGAGQEPHVLATACGCVLCTSVAADEEDSVHLVAPHCPI